jgi:hypothetical protein
MAVFGGGIGCQHVQQHRAIYGGRMGMLKYVSVQKKNLAKRKL